jgi:hypothetical protein
MARYTLFLDWADPENQHRFAESGNTLLDALQNGRVFSVSKANNGDGFCVMEECDSYFNLVLTREQLYELGSELQALAGASQEREAC